ncbi:MAG TPA: hypothetical protein VL221_08775 [Bacteroidota bacterium]|nr:hypothetical protein [Bacteroidota bacterium]
MREALNTRHGAAWRLLACVAAAGTSFNCVNKPLPPVAPTWETAMTAPVAASSYTLADLVTKDPALLSVAPGSTQLVYSSTFQADPAFVGNLIALSPFTGSAQVQMGSFTVAGTTYALPVPFPAWFPKGTTSTIPPGTITIPSLAGTLPGLDSVTFAGGTAELHLRNNLPVPVTIQNSIAIVNAGGTTEGGFSFGGATIAQGQEAVATTNLAGMFLTHTVTLTGLQFSEPGSASPVAIPADSLMVALLVVRNPLVSSAIVTSLPPQVAAQNATRSFAVTDSNLVSDLTVKSGSITLAVNSTLSVNAMFHYAFAEIFTPGGAPYADSLALAPGGGASRTIALAGFRLHNPSGTFIDSLHVTGSVALTQPPGVTSVKVRSSDAVAVTLTTTSIVADSVVGVMKPTWVNVNTVLPVKLGDLSKKFHGQVSIPAANLRIVPQSTIRFPLQLDLKLQAENGQGALLSEMDVPTTTMSGALQPIDFVPGDVGKFLSTISGQFPDSLRVKGAVVVNPNYDRSAPQSVGSTSWFGGQVQVSFPLACALSAGTVADTVAVGDTTGAGHGHTVVDAKTASSINSVTLHVVTDNGIPLGVALKLNFLDAAGKLLLVVPQSAGDSVAVPAPVVAGGDVQAPSHAERIIALSGTEVQQFNKAVTVAYALSVGSPGPDAVRFTSTESVRVRIWAELSYQVNR